MPRSLNFLLKVTYNHEKTSSIMIWADLHLRKIALTDVWNAKWGWIVLEKNKSPSEGEKKSQPELRQRQWEWGGNKFEINEKIKRGDMGKLDENAGLFSCFCLGVILLWPWNCRRRARKIFKIDAGSNQMTIKYFRRQRKKQSNLFREENELQILGGGSKFISCENYVMCQWSPRKRHQVWPIWRALTSPFEVLDWQVVA